MVKFSSISMAAATVALLAFGCGGGKSSSSTLNQGAGQDAAADAAAELTDQQILGILEAANKGEVEQAQAAMPCVTDAAVRAYAQKMIDDHGAMLYRVNAFIERWGMADSPERSELVTKSAATVATLTGLHQSGATCDVQYMASQVVAHSDVLSIIDTKLLPSAKEAEIRTMLGVARPAVAAHLEEAKALGGQPDAGAGDAAAPTGDAAAPMGGNPPAR